MKIIISESKLKRIIREEYSAVLAEISQEDATTAIKKGAFDGAKEGALDRAFGEKDSPAKSVAERLLSYDGTMKPDEWKADEVEKALDGVEKYLADAAEKSGDVGFARASKVIKHRKKLELIGATMLVYSEKGEEEALKFFATEATKMGIEWGSKRVVSGVVSQPILGPILALTFMVPAVFYLEVKRTEDPAERLRDQQKRLYRGAKYNAGGTHERPPLGWDIGIDHPGDAKHQSDLEKNPLYEIIQSRMTRKDPVDVDKLKDEGLIKQEIVDYVKSFEFARTRAKALLARITTAKALGGQRSEELEAEDWGEDKAKRRTQLQALTNAVQGFYDKAKRTMWDYNNNTRWIEAKDERLWHFIQAVDKLVSKIKQLDKVNELDAHKVVRQKFIDGGWKGATGVRSAWYDERRDGLIGALYKQMNSYNQNTATVKGNDLWHERDKMMKKYWNEIESKAENLKPPTDEEVKSAAEELVGVEPS